MQKLMISLVIIAAVAVGGWYVFQADRDVSNETPTPSGPVAVVNGENIDRADYDEMQMQMLSGQGIDMESLDADTQTQIRSQILDILISQTLLNQAVRLADLEVSEEEVEEEMEQIRAQFENEEMFAQILEMQGMTESSLRSQVREDLMAQAYLDQRLDLQSLTATEEEVEAEYAQATAEFEDVPPYEEVRDQIEAFLVQQKQQERVAQLIDELRAEATIEILI